MNNSGLSRHDYHKDKTIPIKQRVTINLRGGEMYDREISGKYSFVMDEGFFRIFDPMGAGNVYNIERGLVGRIEIGCE